jgi:hypothetical protein
MLSGSDQLVAASATQQKRRLLGLARTIQIVAKCSRSRNSRRGHSVAKALVARSSWEASTRSFPQSD